MPWEWSTNVNVMRKGKLARARPEESLDEVEMFEGSENPLVMRQVYAHTFHCKFKLQQFPFDTQACSIDMVLSHDDQNMGELVPSILEMTEDTDLTLFMVKRWVLGYKLIGNAKDGLKMRVVLKRKIMNQLLTTYLPSLLLIVITFATTFFKPFYFEAALGVNLTTMLVMTTIFIGEMQMLPMTAYVKMIDVWLVFCQLVPFTEVLLLTGMEYFRNSNNDQNAAADTSDENANSVKVVWIKALGENIFKEYVTINSKFKFFRKEGIAFGGGLIHCCIHCNCDFILHCRGLKFGFLVIFFLNFETLFLQ